MTNINQKREILRSLNSLDAVQFEKVLNFIKGLREMPEGSFHHESAKRKALKEIGQALQQMHAF